MKPTLEILDILEEIVAVASPAGPLEEEIWCRKLAIADEYIAACRQMLLFEKYIRKQEER